jgi:hypothetical protein
MPRESLLAGTARNLGTLQLRDGAQVSTQSLENSGSIELGGASQLTASTLTIAEGGVLSGARRRRESPTRRRPW